MKSFMGDDFLLSNQTSRDLYNACSDTPIFDWHCHLSPKEIYENKPSINIARLWLGADHYKWRLMRSCGTAEKYITGDADDYEKFERYAFAIQNAPGNPLYHWSHLELRRYFGIYETLCCETAESIWKRANEIIARDGLRPRDLIERSNVICLCTTDDPTDDLHYHELLRNDHMRFRVLPTFRPDRALSVSSDGFPEYISRLSEVSGIKIDSFDGLLNALEERIKYFKNMGCTASDQSVENLTYVDVSQEKSDKIFKSAMSGKRPSPYEEVCFKSTLISRLLCLYKKSGFVTQLHLGAMRNNSTNMFRTLGSDAGCDSIGSSIDARALSSVLDYADSRGGLGKTIIFPLNPSDSYIVGSIIGNFQDGSAKSKLQLGPAWWFNDNADGIRWQLQTLSNLGALGFFVGMITDSRSFLSYPRHEYFRRILCEFIGKMVENGELENKPEHLKKTVKNISCFNALSYFGIGGHDNE